MENKLLKSLTLMLIIFAILLRIKYTTLSTTIFANETVYESMTSAQFLEKSNEEGEITLDKNIILDDSLKINENCTINLNGYTLKFTKDTNLFVNNANATFKNGTINLDGIKGNADCILGVGNHGSSADLTLY